MAREKILVGWTTVDSAQAARQIAAGLITARLAACAQVDGPVASHYVWKGKQTRVKEWRIWVKFPACHAKKITAWLRSNHPYSTPQWLAVETSLVSAPYRQWIYENTRVPALALKKK